MVDVSLGASLLRAVAPGTRVVFVGDPNQLPSVGPGSVLRDMIAAGVPTAMLTQIQRSAGRIVRACHAIKDGVEPRPSGEADIEGGENWIHLESDEPKEIVETIVNLHATVKTMDPLWDMQVVTPQKTRLPFACDNLNRRLSALLNHLAAQEDAANGKAGEVSGEVPRDVQAEGEEGYGPPFRVGDKVVRTKNGIADELMVPGPTNGFITDEEDFRVDWNWDGKPWRLTETDVVNGDMGTVLDIVPGDKDAFVVVKFRLPDRLCRLPYGDCHLIPAYAMTAHKCQGSGFPYVIVPVHHSFYWDQKTQTGLFNRELLYTAISRSEKLLVTVGQASAIRAAIGRKTLHQRNTRLRELLHHFYPIEATSSEA
jgi:exodeoxyribonuclease V alpha subunit